MPTSSQRTPASANPKDSDGNPAPSLFAGMLSEREVIDRLVMFNRHYPTDHDLVDQWASSCPSLARVVADNCRELDDGEDYVETVEIGVAPAWAVLGGASTSSRLSLDEARLRLLFDEA
jgi:hypothetical protein